MGQFLVCTKRMITVFADNIHGFWLYFGDIKIRDTFAYKHILVKRVSVGSPWVILVVHIGIYFIPVSDNMGVLLEDPYYNRVITFPLPSGCLETEALR